MLIGYYQFQPEFGAVSRNLDKIENTLTGCTADIIVLPELCTTGYQFISRDEARGFAEYIPGGAACSRLGEIARKTGIHLVAGIAEKEDDDLYNTAAVISPSGFMSRYRKIHLFFEETLIFTPGAVLPEIISINSAKIAPVICFDWLFPEIFRILALHGVDIVIQPANLVLPYFQTAMRTRSIENRIFTVTANRTGKEERGGKKPLCFTGKSQITGVYGEVLSSASESSETVQIVTINPAEARNKALNPYNSVLGSRRPELYSEIGQPRTAPGG